MVAMELQALAELALKAFQPPRTTDHARLSSQLTKHLRREELGIFSSRFTNGTWHSRLSPTSFYPLQTRVATDAQAVLMVTQ